MTEYTVLVSASAKNDEAEAIDWYAGHYSKAYAKRWYDGLQDALRSLRVAPARCGLIHENARLNSEVRELLYGKSKRNRHRILFTIRGSTVYVLRIWHSAQRDLGEADLPIDA